MIRLPINFELYWGQFCALKIEAGPKKGPAPSEQTQPITNSYSLLHPGVEFSYFWHFQVGQLLLQYMHSLLISNFNSGMTPL